MDADRTSVTARAGSGDADLAAVAALLADRSRCRVLLALDDGRALPASVLAAEAGVSASTISGHLSRLVEGGLLLVEPHGRYRYYRLAGPAVAEVVEGLARLAPPVPVRSLREGSRGQALRAARTCYDHLAGRLGVAVMAGLIERGVLEGGEGVFDPGGAVRDRLAAPGRDLDYRITAHGREVLGGLGVRLPEGRRRPAVRYCVDWSEQRHHLAGGLGAALLDRLVALDWVRRAPRGRAVRLTVTGRDGLRARLGVVCDDVRALPARAA